MHFIIILIVLIVVLLSLSSSSSSSWLWWLHVYIYTHNIHIHIVYMHVCNSVYTFILHTSWLQAPGEIPTWQSLTYLSWRRVSNATIERLEETPVGFQQDTIGYQDTWIPDTICAYTVPHSTDRLYLSVWCRMDASRVSSSFFLGMTNFQGSKWSWGWAMATSPQKTGIFLIQDCGVNFWQFTLDASSSC